MTQSLIKKRISTRHPCKSLQLEVVANSYVSLRKDGEDRWVDLLEGSFRSGTTYAGRERYWDGHPGSCKSAIFWVEKPSGFLAFRAPAGDADLALLTSASRDHDTQSANPIIGHME